MTRFIVSSKIVLTAFILLVVSTVAVASEPITILSFNIRYDNPDDGDNRWELRKEAVAQQIRDIDADVLCLQEALRHQLDDLHELVPGYEEYGVGRDDGVEAGEYCAILVRDGFRVITDSGTFWLSDTPDVPGSVSWGNNVTRIVTWVILGDFAGHNFTVYNTHFDHESQQSRERSAEELRTFIAHRGTPPFIIAGDFNVGEDNPAVMAMTTLHPKLRHVDPEHYSELDKYMLTLDDYRPFRDSFRVIHPNADSVGTFNSWTSNRTGDKIDYIFVSSKWDVVDAGILHEKVNGRYTSDHFPVYARIVLER